MDEPSATPLPQTERARQAVKIIGHPERYKICEACDSIVAERVSTCPNCSGYRFNDERQAVIEQARLLGNREQTSVAAEDLF